MYLKLVESKRNAQPFAVTEREIVYNNKKLRNIVIFKQSVYDSKYVGKNFKKFDNVKDKLSYMKLINRINKIFEKIVSKLSKLRYLRIGKNFIFFLF